MANKFFGSPEKHKYISPSMQKSMGEYMNRGMPQHLKKYQNSGGVMPARIEREMQQHLEKNLPAHMKGYAESYMHQNVLFPTDKTPTPAGSGIQMSTRSTSAYTNRQQVVNVEEIMNNAKSGNNKTFRKRVGYTDTTSSGVGDPQVSSQGSGYDFILNPQTAPRPPIIDLSGAGMFKRIAVLGSGLILLIALFMIGSSFLDRSSKAQGEKLLAIVQTENEIIRVATSATEKISDKNLLFKTLNAKYSIGSSKNELGSELAKRKVKVDEKSLAKGQNSQNDALLLKGEQNGKFDETYSALLAQQLKDYKAQLADAYDASTNDEKAIIQSAYEQIDLLIK